jgi:hypothetical protein
MSGDVERVAEALAAHVEVGGMLTSEGEYVKYVCLCGEGSSDYRWHRTHLAQALLAPGGVVAGMVAEAKDEALAVAEVVDRLAAKYDYAKSDALGRNPCRNASADADAAAPGTESAPGAPRGVGPVSLDPGDELGPENGAGEVCGRCFIEKSANGTCGCEGDE